MSESAVLEAPEVDEQIDATLDPELPIQGPIMEPGAVEHYEHEHYQEIRQRNEAVRELETIHERAKDAAKRAKQNLEDAQAQLTEFISSGPSIPGRKYAKRIRLVKEIEADTELGKKFVTLPKGEVFDVRDIQDDAVAILVQGVVNFLNVGEFEVIEWTEKAPAPEPLLPKIPSRVRVLIDWRSTRGDVQIDKGTEHTCKPAPEGAVVLNLMGAEIHLMPDEYEVIEYATPIDPNGWRSVSIGELIQYGCKPSVNDKLVEAGITTLGKLLDFQKDGTSLTTIKGIAGEKEAQVADAMVAYWQANPQYCQNAAGE